jgi:hypothetical protein
MRLTVPDTWYYKTETTENSISHEKFVLQKIVPDTWYYKTQTTRLFHKVVCWHL